MEFNIKLYTILLYITSHVCHSDSHFNSYLNSLDDVQQNTILDRYYVEDDFDYKKRKRDVTNATEFTTEIVEVKAKSAVGDKNKTEDDKVVEMQAFDKLHSNHEFNASMGSAFDGNDTEPCVGAVEYCNMTKDDYIAMLQEYIFPHAFEWVLICVHAIVFLIGLVGNALVCVAVYRNHSMRTVTNYFIVNLAVADFMVILICLPPTVLWDVTETWFFGTAMCRIVLYFQSVSVTVSVLTLTFISVDRWYAICFPLKFKSTTGRAKTAIVIIWLLSLLFNVPEFLVLEVHRTVDLRFNQQYFFQCTPTWSQNSDLKWQIVKALFLYTFPLVLMTVAYCQIVRVLWRSDNIPGHKESHKLTAATTGQTNWSSATRRAGASIHANASTEGQLRSRRKAAKMLVAVVAMFAVCYFPVHLMSVVRVATDVQQTNVMSCIALLSHVLCYANSAVNPLIYNFMSGKFRREFHRSYFKCLCCCQTPTSPDRNGTSFAPLGSSRAGTTRTIVRRNDSCASYRLTHLSPSNQNSINRDYIRNINTSFIENSNGNRPIRIRDDSISESATRFTTDGRD